MTKQETEQLRDSIEPNLTLYFKNNLHLRPIFPERITTSIYQNDIYVKNQIDKILLKLNSLFGVIKKELKSMNRLESELYAINIIHILLTEIDCNFSKKEIFMKQMEKIYDHAMSEDIYGNKK